MHSLAILLPIGVLLLNLFCIILLLVVENKNPPTTLTWILVLILLPVIGMIFYWFFGHGLRVKQNKKLVEKRQDDKSLDEIIASVQKKTKEYMNQFFIGELAFNDPVTEKYLSVIRMNYFINENRYTQNNNLTIFVNASAKYEALIQDIENAKTSVNMLYFIINNDDIGKRIILALTKKAKEGVQVRVAYDDLGSITTDAKAFDALKSANGKVCRFFRISPRTLLSANYRNHRKIAVIDGEIGYIGGMNIGDEYMGLDPKINPWRDTHLRITGDCVRDLQLHFFKDWLFCSNEEKMNTENLALFFPQLMPEDSTGKIGMQIVSSGPDVQSEQIKQNFIKLFLMAKKSIRIQTPYFIPDQSFLEALQIAAQSGVEVTVMIPGIPDKKAVYNVTQSFIQDLHKFNIKVLKWPGFIHAKMIIIDDEIVTIGTCNMDVRSFSLHFEVNNFIYDQNTALQCVNIFNQDASVSHEVTKQEYASRGLKQKISEGICRLCSPIM